MSRGKRSRIEPGLSPWCQFWIQSVLQRQDSKPVKDGIYKGSANTTSAVLCQAARNYTKTKSMLFLFRARDCAAAKQ